MDEAAFRTAIAAAPADGLVRLALADWLDDAGRPAGAELIRLLLAAPPPRPAAAVARAVGHA